MSCSFGIDGMASRTFEIIEAKSKLITSIGTSLAALLAGTAAFFSAQPTQAELPQAQMDAITNASKDAGKALALANSNALQLATVQQTAKQRRPILGCTVRSLDTLFREHPTITRPCSLNDLPE
jgi:hypothetical protein